MEIIEAHAHTQDTPADRGFVDGHGIQGSEYRNHLAEAQIETERRRCSEDDSRLSKEEANTPRAG